MGGREGRGREGIGPIQQRHDFVADGGRLAIDGHARVHDKPEDARQPVARALRQRRAQVAKHEERNHLRGR